MFLHFFSYFHLYTHTYIQIHHERGDSTTRTATTTTTTTIATTTTTTTKPLFFTVSVLLYLLALAASVYSVLLFPLVLKENTSVLVSLSLTTDFESNSYPENISQIFLFFFLLFHACHFAVLFAFLTVYWLFSLCFEWNLWRRELKNERMIRKRAGFFVSGSFNIMAGE